MIKFECSCGRKLAVPEEYAGKLVRCPGCNAGVKCPAISSSEPAAIHTAPAKPRSPWAAPAAASPTNSNLKAIIAVALIAAAAVVTLVIYFSSRTQMPPQQLVATDRQAAKPVQRGNDAGTGQPQPINTGIQQQPPPAPSTSSPQSRVTAPTPPAAPPTPQLTPTPPAQPTATPSAADLYAKASPAVVRVVCGDVSGSGFFISAKGLVVTNYHVIEGANAISVVLPSNAKFSVKKVLVRDRIADLAILDTGADGVPFLQLAAMTPDPGERVYAIGNPLGLENTKNTLSEGLVSGLREDKGIRYIQTTAAINPGSSGGPLLLSSGQVVGVTTFTYLRSQNLNFAVLWSHVKKAVDDAAAPQTASSPASQPGRPNPVLAVKDYDSYSDRTQKLIVLLQRLDSDIEVGMNYATHHEAVSDLNFAARLWREALSDEEKKLYSARCILAAIDLFKTADEYWRKAIQTDYGTVEVICKRVLHDSWANASASVAIAEKAIKAREELTFPVTCGACDGTGKVICPMCGGIGKSLDGTMCDICKGKGKMDCRLCEGDGKIDLSTDKKKAKPGEATAGATAPKGLTDEEQRKRQEQLRQEQLRQAQDTLQDIDAQLQRLDTNSIKITEYVKLQAEVAMLEPYENSTSMPKFAERLKAAKERLTSIGFVPQSDVDAYRQKRQAILNALEEAKKHLRSLGG